MVNPYAGLNDRITQLKEWASRMEAELRHAPKGTLIVRNKERRNEWYYATEDEATKEGGRGTRSRAEECAERKRKEVYLRKKDRGFAVELAQRDYNRKVLKSAKTELQALRDLAENLPAERAEQVFEKLSHGRQELIEPLVLSDAVYSMQWQEALFESKPVSEDVPVHLTAKGERVRSKSEVLIADHLTRKGLPYRYEPLLTVKGRRFHPDFLVLDPVTRREYYWEHLGKLDDPLYARETVKRIQFYVRNGIIPGVNLILSWETSEDPLNAEQIEALIRAHFH